MRKKAVIFSPIVLLSVLYFSCRKEIKNPSWDIDVLAPMVKSSFSINDIITDSLLVANPDNSLDIVYHSSLTSFAVDSLFKIPDTTIHNVYPSPFNFYAVPGGLIIPLFNNPITYTLGTAKLTTVTIHSGKMLLTITSQLKGDVDFTYTLPKVVDKYGNIFDTTVTIPAMTGTVIGTYTGVFDLSGYKIDLKGPTGTSSNTMITSYTAVASPLNTYTTNITAGEIIDIENKFVDIVPEYAKGYFGQYVTDIGPDTADFSMFSRILDGSIGLEDIDITLEAENRIGTDIRLTINDLSSVNTRTGNSVSLTSSLLSSPVNITRAVDNNGVVSASTSALHFNTTNSNMKSLIENLPDKFSYELGMEINPLGNVSGSNDFIYYDQLLKTDLNITIPLSLVANNLTMGDTVDFNMNNSLDNVSHGKLYLYADNGFPFTAEAQVYVLNTNLDIVDSLISAPNVIEAPALDANYICVGQQTTKLTIPLDSDKLNTLRTEKKLYIKMRFNTAGQPNYVKIYNFYKMDVKLVADFNYTVNK